MTFHLRVTLQDLPESAARSYLALGDTFVVEAAATRNLTAGVQRDYKEISYQMESSDNEKENGQEESKESDSGDEHEVRKGLSNVIQETRLRKKNVGQHAHSEERQKSQEELLDRKLVELKKRYENNEIQCATKTEKVKKMDGFVAYTQATLPKDLKAGELYVDKKN